MVRQKRMSWCCADCDTEINDENMRVPGNQYDPDVPIYAEFCDVCYIYNPEVVLKYD